MLWRTPYSTLVFENQTWPDLSCYDLQSRAMSLADPCFVVLCDGLVSMKYRETWRRLAAPFKQQLPCYFLTLLEDDPSVQQLMASVPPSQHPEMGWMPVEAKGLLHQKPVVAMLLHQGNIVLGLAGPPTEDALESMETAIANLLRVS